VENVAFLNVEIGDTQSFQWALRCC